MTRVLVVEDNADAAELLKRLLEREGFDVVTAGSMAAAIEAAGGIPFDILLSDVVLPDGTGYGLMARLREERTLPGIAMSGYGEAGDVARSRAAGFDEHLVKPFAIDVVVRAIRRLAAPPGAAGDAPVS